VPLLIEWSISCWRVIFLPVVFFLVLAAFLSPVSADFLSPASAAAGDAAGAGSGAAAAAGAAGAGEAAGSGAAAGGGGAGGGGGGGGGAADVSLPPSGAWARTLAGRHTERAAARAIGKIFFIGKLRVFPSAEQSIQYCKHTSFWAPSRRVVVLNSTDVIKTSRNIRGAPSGRVRRRCGDRAARGSGDRGRAELQECAKSEHGCTRLSTIPPVP